MNSKKEIESLRNSIKANECLIESNPEKKEYFEAQNIEKRKRIQELETPVKTHSKPIQMGEAVVDQGDNCLAIQKNGKACQCKRVYGNYCGKHIKHYVEELNDN